MTDQPSYRLIAAGVILLAYFLVAGLLLMRILGDGVPAAEWDHVVLILNAIGALATTAAGVLFGAEVQQANVRFAQKDSQLHAANAARKDEAMLQALESLEGNTQELKIDAGSARARNILQRSIGNPIQALDR